MAAILDEAGTDKSTYSSALQELERHLAGHPGERQDAALALLGRLLGDFVGCTESRVKARQRIGEESVRDVRLQQRADSLASQNASLASELEKVSRERDELKALVQRLKDLEMSMEEKRKRLR